VICCSEQLIEAYNGKGTKGLNRLLSMCHAMPRMAANGMPLRVSVYAICDAFAQGCTETNAFKRVHEFTVRYVRRSAEPCLGLTPIVNLIYITICSTSVLEVVH